MFHFLVNCLMLLKLTLIFGSSIAYILLKKKKKKKEIEILLPVLNLALNTQCSFYNLSGLCTKMIFT